MIGITHANNNAGHARGDDRINTRRCPPLVDARLEGHIEGCGLRRITSCLQCERFGMLFAGTTMRTFREDRSVRGHDHRANPGIGVGMVEARQIDRPTHVSIVEDRMQ